MSDEIEVRDGTSDRRYFVILPNLVDDLALSPYAVRLYLRIKRRAGETGGCWENTRNLAAACRMSTAQVSRAKKELQAAGLIAIEQRQGAHGHWPGHTVTIQDVWKQNAARYEPVTSGNTTCYPGDTRPVTEMRLKKNPFKKIANVNKKKSAPTTATHAKKRHGWDSDGSINNHHSLVETIAHHVTEQNRTPNHDAIVKAIALWRDECERVKEEDGVTWKTTNLDAILERYDILTLEAKK